MNMKYRIREHRRITVLSDNPNGEFDRVHPSERYFAIETMTWPPVDIGRKFPTFNAAQKWAKLRKYEIVEVA